MSSCVAEERDVVDGEVRTVTSELLDNVSNSTTVVDEFVETRFEVCVADDDPHSRDDNNNVVDDDDDGDILPPRRHTQRRFVWRVRWKTVSQLDAVGVQLWSGALLMCDFVLGSSSPMRCYSRVLELGCGVGLVGLALQTLPFLQAIHLTDVNEDALQLCRANIDVNRASASCTVSRLDWFDEPGLFTRLNVYKTS